MSALCCCQHVGMNSFLLTLIGFFSLIHTNKEAVTDINLLCCVFACIIPCKG